MQGAFQPHHSAVDFYDGLDIIEAETKPGCGHPGTTSTRTDQSRPGNTDAIIAGIPRNPIPMKPAIFMASCISRIRIDLRTRQIAASSRTITEPFRPVTPSPSLLARR